MAGLSAISAAAVGNSATSARLASQCQVVNCSALPFMGISVPQEALPGHGSPRGGNPATWLCQAGQDFFQTDVVEYGNRYNRPDRFPRLKQADRARRSIHVDQWLERLVEVARECGVADAELVLPNCKQVVQGREAAAKAKQVALLTRQGRVEEVLRLVEAWDLQQEGEGPSEILDHGLVVQAAADAGEIALAFEYVGLLPASMHWYNLLMAIYTIRGDWDAVRLARNTASRRGIPPTALSFLIEAAGAAEVRDDEGRKFLKDAKEQRMLHQVDVDYLWSGLAKFKSTAVINS